MDCFSFLCLTKICCFHDGQASKNEKKLLLNIESLSLCKKTPQLRTDFKLKYGNVKLPDDVDKTHGYHMKCLRNLQHFLSHIEKN